MNVDYFFTIGALHAEQGYPCEDYARSGILPGGQAFGAVADGCTGAAACTEVGAQALAYAFERTLLRKPIRAGEPVRGEGAAERRSRRDRRFGDRLFAEFSSRRISAVDQDYFATLIGFVADPEHACVHVFGDGAIVFRFADDHWQLIEIEWVGNAPYYLAYRLCPEYNRVYIERMAQLAVPPVSVRTTSFRRIEGAVEILEVSTAALSFGEAERGLRIDCAPAAEGIRMLAVFSDGIARISGLSAPAAAAELLDCARGDGQFLKRHCLERMTPEWRSRYVPDDDLAIAAVIFDDA